MRATARQAYLEGLIENLGNHADRIESAIECEGAETEVYVSTSANWRAVAKLLRQAQEAVEMLAERESAAVGESE